MEITEQILLSGVRAIRRHTEMARPKHDNKVPERFITSLMATCLYDYVPTRIVKLEQQYVDVANDLGIAMMPEARQAVLGLSADIGIYEGLRPTCLIEVKKFDEGCPVRCIKEDLDKGDPIGLSAHVGVYAGVMVCETPNARLDARKRELEQIDDSRWTFSSSIQSVDRNWFWCFGCGQIIA